MTFSPSKILLNLSFLFLVVYLLGCTRAPSIVSVSGNTMGTYFVVKVVGEVEQSELLQRVEEKLAQLNKIYSTYDPDSELSKINASDQTQHTLSPELAQVLMQAEAISNLTRGHFDVTVGPLVNAWGFGPTGIKRRPQMPQIRELLQSIGYKKISIQGLRLTRPAGMYIDLSAIAKGHAVDRVLELLVELGHTQVLVEIGGEIRTMGKKSEKDYWKVGIEQPTEQSAVSRVVPLENMAIATSGSYRNFRKYGEEIFSHTIDPTTGQPVKHQLISVSVLAKTCTEADALATALMVMGPEKGLELTNERGILAYFMVKEGDRVFTQSSDSFKKYLKKYQVPGKAL